MGYPIELTQYSGTIPLNQPRATTYSRIIIYLWLTLTLNGPHQAYCVVDPMDSLETKNGSIMS